MDNNVTKNTFFNKWFKLNFFDEHLSLKQLIQQELLDTIALYQQQYPKVNNWQQITVSLGSKITLCSPQNFSWQLRYRCAVAFPIANLVYLPPLSVAHQLVTLLSSGQKKVTNKDNLEVRITIVKSGWIDFSVCDRSISIWLDRLVKGIATQTNFKQLDLVVKKSKKAHNLFPLQYIYSRCSSLLQLGEKEGLIVLKTEDRSFLKWEIKQPFPLQWHNSQGNLCLSCPQERDLIWHICLIMDYLAESKQYNSKHWLKFTDDISKVWLRFIAHCRFCGEVRQQNPTLAIARLGLIALSHWCLQAILVNKLNIIPQRDIWLE